MKTSYASVLMLGTAFSALASAALADPQMASTPATAAGADEPIVAAQADQSSPASTSSGSSPTPVGEVVVTGIRHGEITAQAVKRANEDIVDVISAEDIGKLPDASIADSIARLPGLAAQRDNSGRTQDISIDGLPSAMNTTLLNGFMQATTDNNRTTQLRRADRRGDRHRRYADRSADRLWEVGSVPGSTGRIRPRGEAAAWR
jgi:iron complex outermembrane receptor protein